MSWTVFHIIFKQVARTKSAARPMTSEELAADGVPLTEGITPSITNDPATEIIHDSGSRKDGEIRFENRSGGEEDLSNIDVHLNKLVVVKAASHPQLLSSEN
jgi:hypothetical protein